MMNMKKILIFLCVFVVAAIVAGLARFEFAPPEKTCILCNELKDTHKRWSQSAHKDVNCKACHGRTLESLGDNLKRVCKHFTSKDYSRIGFQMCLSEEQIEDITERCISCHRAEGAQWKRSGHASPVEKFLTNTLHNVSWKPSDVCLKCHGMFLEGDIENIIGRKGLLTEWKMRKAKQGKRYSVPCLACHNIHGGKNLAFYQRGDNSSVSAELLHIRDLKTSDGKPVLRGVDAQSRLCTQCHAANAEGIAGSADDPSLVCRPDGKGCLDCHRGHDYEVRGKR
jgi:hypothetical protein